MSVHSKHKSEHEHMNRISTDAKKWHSFVIRRLDAAVVWREGLKRSIYGVWMKKALSDECRLSLRMRNECNFLASVDICFMPVWALDAHHEVMCVVCACYFSPLLTSFVFQSLNVIRFVDHAALVWQGLKASFILHCICVVVSCVLLPIYESNIHRSSPQRTALYVPHAVSNHTLG